MLDPVKVVTQYQRDLFARLDEFFVRATGKSAAEFATIDEFGDRVRSRAQELAPLLEAAFEWLYPELGSFYEREASQMFGCAKAAGGMKLILGGGSRFGQSQLQSVTTSALYSDTVLIPDPVLPWLENERTEERFSQVLLLQVVHALLHLKPLVDADLQYPAVLVFPSWEKTLEDKDKQTQSAILQLIADVFSHFLGENLGTLEEVRDYADRKPEQFLTKVDANHLFVAPGGPVDEPIAEALVRYQTYLETWRSSEWLAAYGLAPIHRRVLNGVAEYVGPVYHLLENAEEIGGHPLMCLDQHAHYYRLVAAANSARLERLRLLGDQTKALVDAMGSRRLNWLSSVSIEELAGLRMDNANVTFRKRLEDAVGRLHESTLFNVDKVAAEICQELESAITDHENELRRVQQKYTRVHARTLIGALGAAAVTWIPSLAPFLGASIPFLAVATTYGVEKWNELVEKHKLTRSLMGVLVTARSRDS